MFRYEDGAASREVKFNYTLDPDAQLLLDWFERLTETSMHTINLEHTARFDRLGLDKALLLLQVSADRDRLAGARQLLPILDRIAKTKPRSTGCRSGRPPSPNAIRAARTKTD